MKTLQELREYRKQHRLANRDQYRAYEARQRRKNREKLKIQARERKSHVPSFAARLLSEMKKRSRQYGVECSLTKEDLIRSIETGICPRTGFAFHLGGNGKSFAHPLVPTIDRLDAGGDYSHENTQVVSWVYNRAKGSGSDGDVLRFCKALVSHHARD